MPILFINKHKLIENINTVQRESGKSVSIATKIFKNRMDVIAAILESNVNLYYDTCLKNALFIKGNNPSASVYWLPSDLDSLKKFSSKTKVIPVIYNLKLFNLLDLENINEFAIFVDIGDGREGFSKSDLEKLAKIIPVQKTIQLFINYGCFTRNVFNVEIVENVVQSFKSYFKFQKSISWGGSYFLDHELPCKYFSEKSHIRVGESYLFGNKKGSNEQLWGMHQDIFKVQIDVLQYNNDNTALVNVGYSFMHREQLEKFLNLQVISQSSEVSLVKFSMQFNEDKILKNVTKYEQLTNILNCSSLRTVIKQDTYEIENALKHQYPMNISLNKVK